MDSPRTAHRIRVRAMQLQLDDAIPRWWFFDNPWPTHVANALNLLFPDGERFFIRSVKHYLDRIEDDPELVARVRGFFGQEGRHGHEHERYNRVLERQGYDLERFLALYRRIAFGVIEPAFPPHVRLAATAALEHFTATMAHNALEHDLLDHADPRMAALLRWHAAEEIEHKSVAFDVLQRVDPRWTTRALGLAMAISTLGGFWVLAVRMLLRQERARGVDLRAMRERVEREPRLVAERARRTAMFRDAIVSYLRPGFHPDRVDDYHLARAYLERIGRLDA